MSIASLIITIAWIAYVLFIGEGTCFWRWWAIVFMTRMWSYVEPIWRRDNRTLANWTVQMITFMITDEIGMDRQVTLVALSFFQNCSKFSTNMHNKGVLIYQSILISIVLFWRSAVEGNQDWQWNVKNIFEKKDLFESMRINTHW